MGERKNDEEEFHSKLMYGTEHGRVAIEDSEAKSETLSKFDLGSTAYRAKDRIDKLEFWMYREMIQRNSSSSTLTMKRLSDDARAFLLDQASMNVLDLGGRMDDMSTPLIEEIAHSDQFQQCHVLRLSGWKGISSVKLRPFLLAVGDQLESIDLSETGVNEPVLESIMLRTFNLREINLSNCIHVNGHCIRDIVISCHNTLNSLDVSRCRKLTRESLAWLGGALGFQTPPCKQLLSLNAEECVGIQDASLTGISKGCIRLRYLNVSGCRRLTDRGVNDLTKGCRRLTLLNLSRCFRITNASLKYLGSRCPSLRSLHLGGCENVGDLGIKALGNGCSKLQALNVSGCYKISEGGICAVAQTCSSMQLLNLDGLDKVTHTGLEHLVQGLPYVSFISLSLSSFLSHTLYSLNTLNIDTHPHTHTQNNRYVVMATSFYGFKPRSDTLHLKFKTQNRMIMDNMASRLQKQYRVHRSRKHVDAICRSRAVTRAGHTIVRVARGFRARRRVRHIQEQNRRREQACVILQARVRSAAMRKMFLVKAKNAAIERKLNRIVKFQACYRGYKARQRLPEVARITTILRNARDEEILHLVAVRIQIEVRAYLARKRFKVLAKEIERRRKDMLGSAVVLQSLVRGRKDRVKVGDLRWDLRQGRLVKMNAATRIQASFRGFLATKLRHAMEYEVKIRDMLEVWAATTTQRAFRGLLGRNLYKIAKIQRARHIKASVEIQRMVRGYLVPSWRVLRLRKVTRIVRKRHKEKAKVCKTRSTKWLEELDSASESDDSDPEFDWQEHVDAETSRRFYFSPSRNERRYDPPVVRHKFLRTFVGKRVRIFWDTEKDWMYGTVDKYNAKRKKHRVTYDIGTTRWHSLSGEHKFVQVMNPVTNTWLEFRNIDRDWLQVPSVAVEPSNTTWQAFDDGAGNIYYYNSETGESQWDRPDEYVG
jgi:hypothetical protein